MAKAKQSLKKAIVKAKDQSLKPKMKQGKVKEKTTEAFKTPKLNVPKVAYKKSEFLKVLSEQSHISKKEVSTVLEAILKIATLHLDKKGPGQFTYPGLFKMRLKTKAATPERTGRNPFTGQEMIVKAKPARRVIKVSVLKNFKNAVA